MVFWPLDLCLGLRRVSPSSSRPRGAFPCGLGRGPGTEPACLLCCVLGRPEHSTTDGGPRRQTLSLHSFGGQKSEERNVFVGRCSLRSPREDPSLPFSSSPASAPAWPPSLCLCPHVALSVCVSSKFPSFCKDLRFLGGSDHSICIHRSVTVFSVCFRVKAPHLTVVGSLTLNSQPTTLPRA